MPPAFARVVPSAGVRLRAVAGSDGWRSFRGGRSSCWKTGCRRRRWTFRARSSGGQPPTGPRPQLHRTRADRRAGVNVLGGQRSSTGLEETTAADSPASARCSGVSRSTAPRRSISCARSPGGVPADAPAAAGRLSVSSVFVFGMVAVFPGDGTRLCGRRARRRCRRRRCSVRPARRRSGDFRPGGDPDDHAVRLAMETVRS